MTTRRRDTSRLAHREIAATLSRRQGEVRVLLQEYRAAHHDGPTAAELLAFARRMHPAYACWDVNSVRPRLTEMQATHEVTTGEKRRCAITGKLAYTWVLCGRVQPLPVEDLAAARQGAMFP